jgi:hypothetical protein
MTTGTLFDIASASKSLTAASIVLLVEDEGHPDVNYDARVSDLLPGDFEMPGEEHEDVTLDDLLGPELPINKQSKLKGASLFVYIDRWSSLFAWID